MKVALIADWRHHPMQFRLQQDNANHSQETDNG